MHSSVVAHQCFALKALSWLGQIIQYSGTSGHYFPASPCLGVGGGAACSLEVGVTLSVRGVSDGLRRVLCQVGLQRGPEGENSSLVDQLMLNDSKMWKGDSDCDADSHHTFMTLIHGDQEQQKAWKATDLSVCLSRYLSVSPGLCPSACRSEEHLPPAVDEQPPHGPQIQEDLCCTVCQGNTPDQHSCSVQSIPQCTTACCRLIFDVQPLINRCNKYSQVN